ncbi:MAG: hypothetical protein PHZ19_10615 [Candidatus Thermoplasmatota archaeon]|nr:hypothetical protein [Candidatus Thermoplasmatota archaeon]
MDSMKITTVLPVFCVLAVLVAPLLLGPVLAEQEEQTEVRYVICGEEEWHEERECLSPSQADAVVRVMERVHQGLRALRTASTAEEMAAARECLLEEMAGLSWLKIFVYLVDLLEDVIDSYITPWTTVTVGAHIFSLGHGRAFIPLDCHLPLGVTRQTFVGLLLRPVWWDYNMLSYTLVRRGSVFPPRIDFWDTLGRQQGFMVGFFGLHLSVLRPLAPDTHLFMGRTLFLVNKDLLL